MTENLMGRTDFKTSDDLISDRPDTIIEFSDALDKLVRKNMLDGNISEITSGLDFSDQYAALRFIRTSQKYGLPKNMTWEHIPGDEKNPSPYWIGTCLFDTGNGSYKAIQCVSNQDPATISSLKACDVYLSNASINDSGSFEVDGTSLEISSKQYASPSMETVLSQITPSLSHEDYIDAGIVLNQKTPDFVWHKQYEWTQRNIDGQDVWIGTRNLTGEARGPNDNVLDIEYRVSPFSPEDPQAEDNSEIYIQRRKVINQMAEQILSDDPDYTLSDSGEILWTIKKNRETRKATVGMDAELLNDASAPVSPDVSTAPLESIFQWAKRVDFESKLYQTEKSKALGREESGRVATISEKIKATGIALAVVGGATLALGVAPFALSAMAIGAGLIANIPMLAEVVQAKHIKAPRYSTDTKFNYTSTGSDDSATASDYGVYDQSLLISAGIVEKTKRSLAKTADGISGFCSGLTMQPFLARLGKNLDSDIGTQQEGFLQKSGRWAAGTVLAATAIYTAPVWMGTLSIGLAFYGLARGYIDSTRINTPREYRQSDSLRKWDSRIGLLEETAGTVVDAIGHLVKQVGTGFGIFSGQSGLGSRLGKKREVHEETSIASTTLKEPQIKPGF